MHFSHELLKFHKLQYLPNHSSKFDSKEVSVPPHNFETIDMAFASFGFDDAERLNIYKILVGILLLEDITFEMEFTNREEMCNISKSSIYILNNIAELFQLDALTLENALVSRSIRIKDSKIKFVLSYQNIFFKILR